MARGFSFFLSFSVLALGTEHLGATALYNTHPSPFFSLFLCRQLISSSSFLHLRGEEYMGNDMKHTWHDTRRFFYTGEGGRIYSTRQLGGKGGGRHLGKFQVTPLFFSFSFGLDFASQNLAGLRTVLWLFFFIVRSNVFFCGSSSSLPYLGFSLPLSLTHVSHSRLLVVLLSHPLFPTC